MLYINLFKYHHHYLYCNNDLETKLDILLLKLRMMTQKAGIFELCFDKNKKILTFQEIWIILALFTTLMTNLAVVLKFKFWQETFFFSRTLLPKYYYNTKTQFVFLRLFSVQVGPFCPTFEFGALFTAGFCWQKT